MAERVRSVVSVSLGTSKRDKRSELEILGVPFSIERRGTDGDRKRFAALFAELDGRVDALGIGGADLYLVIGRRRYVFRDVARLVAGARRTPVVDGSGLKHTLERSAVEWLRDSGTVDFARARVLLVSAVDRFGMAQALAAVCPRVVYGDLLYAVGLPLPIRRYRTVERLGRLALPIVTRLPFHWFYPTGEKQERRSPRYERFFREADLIAGDWHFIRRFCPDRLDGKTILTQTLRKDDYEWLRRAGALRAVTTTPSIGGESFATNVMEGVVVALLGKRPEAIGEDEMRAVLGRLGWRPHVVELGSTAAVG